jgi:hypothetical protein
MIAMGKYLDLLTAGSPAACDKSDKSDKSLPFGRLSRFGRILEALERRCPDHVDPADWELAVADGRMFLALWGQQAEALGWSTADLFGLAPVPERPPANYRRLSRYDLTGLLWLLRGRPVVALTTTTAAVQTPSGAILTYRRHRKPPLGPLGDSLDDALELGLIDDQGSER